MEISESEKNFAIAEDINLKRSKLVGLMGAKDYGTWVFNLDKEMTNIMNEFSSKTTFMPNNKESIELRSKIEDIKKKYESLRDMLT